MVVSIMWSESTGGTAAMDDPKDWGNIGNGSGAAPLTIYLTHDGTEKITSAALYVQAYSGTGYSGGADPATDLAELLAWGDAHTDAVPAALETGSNFGGFWISFNAGGGGGTDSEWYVHDSSTGVSGAEFPVSTDMGVGTDDEIQPAEEATFHCAIIVPLDEDTAGTRFFDQCLKYTYTS